MQVPHSAWGTCCFFGHRYSESAFRPGMLPGCDRGAFGRRLPPQYTPCGGDGCGTTAAGRRAAAVTGGLRRAKFKCSPRPPVAIGCIPGFTNIKGGFRTRTRGRGGIQSQNRAFLLLKGGRTRGFGRKIGLFCYRRVVGPGGSVAKSGFFATEEWSDQGVRSRNRAFLLPKGGRTRGFSRKNRLYCYRRVGCRPDASG